MSDADGRLLTNPEVMHRYTVAFNMLKGSFTLQLWESTNTPFRKLRSRKIKKGQVIIHIIP
jgi:hypothetical protein